MSEHKAHLEWTRNTPDFGLKTYTRDHTLSFDGGATLMASAAAGPHIPPGTASPSGIDPEEMTVAALSSCHMLFFLALAARKGLVIDRYEDDPVGVLETIDRVGSLTSITLRPRVTWGGDPPDQAVVDELHHDAHRRCYIGNSLRSDVKVEPVH